MDEKSTSPIKGITRRYPQILILKPFDSCPQICVYCQRNWEITDIKDAIFSRDTMTNAIKWIKDNRLITEDIYRRWRFGSGKCHFMDLSVVRMRRLKISEEADR